jgi:hypothetical protein
MFAAANFIASAHTRRIFLPVVNHLSKDRKACEWYIGMNAYSTDWGELYHTMMLKLNRTFGGDFSKYDKSMSAGVIRKSYEVLIAVMEAGGATQSQILQARTLAEDAIYPLYAVRSDFFVLTGSNPSGHAMTVFINSIANSLLTRSAYYVVGLCHFNLNVILATYGDDNLVTSIKGVFTFVMAREGFAILGLVYTPADKSDTSPLFDKEVVFLKRGFVWDDGHCRAPLFVGSIIKSFCWRDKNSLGGEISFLASVLKSALLELA